MTVSGGIPTLKTGLAHPHPEPISGARYSAVELMPGDRRVIMLDQRRLPNLEHYEMYTRVEEVAEAIRAMVVRGAPAIETGKRVRVLATETRPYLQGARLTAWELSKDGIPVEVITDNMVGHFMQKREIDLVIVGADRIARSGDVANKIGTYGVAVLAQAHGVPFYVAAPWSTVDLACPSGNEIPIEQRSDREVTHFGEVQLVPDAVSARHPAFDVTPARLIRAIFTERGTISPVDEEHLVRAK